MSDLRFRQFRMKVYARLCPSELVPAEREDKIKDYLRRLEYPHDIIKGKSVEVFFDRDPKQWGSLAKDCYGSFRVTP